MLHVEACPIPDANTEPQHHEAGVHKFKVEGKRGAQVAKREESTMAGHKKKGRPPRPEILHNLGWPFVVAELHEEIQILALSDFLRLNDEIENVVEDGPYEVEKIGHNEVVV